MGSGPAEDLAVLAAVSGAGSGLQDYGTGYGGAGGLGGGMYFGLFPEKGADRVPGFGCG